MMFQPSRGHERKRRVLRATRRPVPGKRAAERLQEGAEIRGLGRSRADGRAIDAPEGEGRRGAGGPPVIFRRRAFGAARAAAAEAAIDQQVDAGHEGGGVREQEHRRADHLVDIRHPAHRRLLLEELRLVHHLGTGVHRGRGIAGADRVHPDAARDPFHRHRLRHVDDTGLRGVVVALREPAVHDHPRHGGDVDDRAAPMRQHRPRLGLAGEKDALEVDVHQALELALLHLLRRIGIGDPGRVHREREGAEFLLGARDRLRERRAARHVGGEREALSPGGGDRGGGVGEPGIRPPVEERHIRAALGEADGDALADAAARSGDEGDLAGEIEELRRVQGDVHVDPQMVASSMTETSFASPRSRIPACLPWASTTIRLETPSTSSRSELTTMTATPSSASPAMMS